MLLLAAGLPSGVLAQVVSMLGPPCGAARGAAWSPGTSASALWPAQKPSATRCQPVLVDGQPQLRIEAVGSYGKLMHPLQAAPGRGSLSWRWRIEELHGAADLRRRETDDSSLKVCVLFDMALERVPFVERQRLRLARSHSAHALPAAAVCDVWDARLPVGSRIDNACSRRVRYLVLRSPPAPLRLWASERRDVAADFLMLFGDESPNQVPPLLAVVIDADSDNTGGRSLACLAELALVEAP